MIQEDRALKTLSIEGAHGREDPFRDYFTGVKDATGLSDLEVLRKDSGMASILFNEVQQALNRASALHREAFSQSRAELSRYEADLRGLTEERNALRLLCGQKKEETKDLRAELAKAHQDQTDLIEQLQQKVERIEQLREEVDMMKAETLGWKEGMDLFAVEKENALSQLETLEEIHARVFDLTDEIIKAREREADAGALASSDDDDDAESKSGSESGEDLDGEEASPGEN
ncbi:uncharacterized protein [Nicotiana tomentosiformis]|uniref:uncharacterized protein n=1 Tax=Nicotiana tomentosiformis TaxID=4098 RepID=UPI00388CA6E5